MASEKVNNLGVRLQQGHKGACEHLLAPEGEKDRLPALGEGSEVEVAHLCDIQEAVAALVVENDEVVQARELVFRLQILNAGKIPRGVHILHAQAGSFVEEHLVHEAPEVSENLAHWRKKGGRGNDDDLQRFFEFLQDRTGLAGERELLRPRKVAPLVVQKAEVVDQCVNDQHGQNLQADTDFNSSARRFHDFQRRY